MDGRGAWRDNVSVERLWRSVKYEEVYLRAYDSVAEARTSIGRYFDFYNRKRPHSNLDARTPDQAYFDALPLVAAARFSPPFGGIAPVGLRPPYAMPPNGNSRQQPEGDPLIGSETLFRQSRPPLIAIFASPLSEVRGFSSVDCQSSGWGGEGWRGL